MAGLAVILAGGWLAAGPAGWCGAAETPEVLGAATGARLMPSADDQPAITADGKPTPSADGLSTPTRDGRQQGPALSPGAKTSVASPTATPLAKEKLELRDRVRRVLAGFLRQPLNTADNTPAEILAFCLAYGCDAEVRFGGSGGQPISAVGCLCWNYSCAGYELLTSDGQHPIARIGYGLQSYPSQFLGVLAQAGVPASYEVRVGKFHGTVADLVAAEQLDCQPGTDLSHKLMGMAFYVPAGQSWKDRAGGTWSVARLVNEELARDVPTHGPEAVYRLMGLSFAVHRQRRQKEPLDGPFAQAEKYLAQYRDFALGLQNPDGSWHPRLFAARGTSPDAWGTLRATALIGQWLALSLPQSRLEDPRMIKAVERIAAGLETLASGWNVAASNPRDIQTVGYALYALRIYDSRGFQASAPEQAPAAYPDRQEPAAQGGSP